jgi:DNA repair exonuclease SbcCD ATPase subunit
MTDREKKISEIREALERATPGPWEVTNLGDVHITKDYRMVDGRHIAMWIADMCEDRETVDQIFADAHLIANAPKWLRYLLQQIEQQQAEIEAMRLSRDFEIKESNKAKHLLQQYREEYERLRGELEQVKAERDEQKVKKREAYRNIAGWQERVYDLEAELSEKDKVLEWYADNDSYTVLHLGCSPMVMADRGAAARSILSRYKERGDSQ